MGGREGGRRKVRVVEEENTDGGVGGRGKKRVEKEKGT